MAGALNYILETQNGKMPKLSPPQRFMADHAVYIDGPTRKSLELSKSQQGTASEIVGNDGL